MSYNKIVQKVLTGQLLKNGTTYSLSVATQTEHWHRPTAVSDGVGEKLRHCLEKWSQDPPAGTVEVCARESIHASSSDHNPHITVVCFDADGHGKSQHIPDIDGENANSEQKTGPSGSSSKHRPKSGGESSNQHSRSSKHKSGGDSSRHKSKKTSDWAPTVQDVDQNNWTVYDPYKHKNRQVYREELDDGEGGWLMYIEKKDGSKIYIE